MAGSIKRPLVRILTGLAVILAVAVFLKSRSGPPDLAEVSHYPGDILGGPCELKAVVPSSDAASAEAALLAAAAELRRADSLMSVNLAGSDVSRLNAAAAGETVKLSLETMAVLRAAKLGYEATGGAYDATARPLIEAWMSADGTDSPPSAETLALAREASTWRHFRLLQTTVIKSVGTACVDFGGVARGFAIDNAIEVLQSAGCEGGLVRVAGDVRTFGPGPSGTEWQVALKNPFGDDVWGRLPASGAVCTSDAYERYVTIQGRRYSHIIDPRTGQPADLVPAATVSGMSAATADIWSTALSVLGATGFASLPEESGLEAMVVTGTRNDYQVKMTSGFREMLRGKVVFEAEVQ